LEPEAWAPPSRRSPAPRLLRAGDPRGLAPERAKAAAERLGEPDRFTAELLDASTEQLVELIGRVNPDAMLNATDPRLNAPIFNAAFEARITYLDVTMTLSHPQPERSYELSGETLGDTGVLGPEAFPPRPFLELLAELGSPHGVRELLPE
jgi:hypothetical protein